MTAGVVEEFDLIREFGRMRCCLVVVLDAGNTPNSDSDDASRIRTRLADFSNVFELRPGKTGAETSYPEELGTILTGLLRNAKTEARLERAVEADFTYLEPGFTDSEDFATTQAYIWRSLRHLRVILEGSYWAALKSSGIPFQHCTFPGPWKMAHQTYGLAIATADFRAIHESLQYLTTLYMARGEEFAFSIHALIAKFDELAEQIFRAGPPETESRYASGPDPLKLPAEIVPAVELFQVAEEAARGHDRETANHLYQAAVICAIRATDGDDRKRRWIVANMCLDWAKYQGKSAQIEWAVANCAFAAKLFRDLAAADPDRYMSDLAVCLNNLGSLHFQRRDFAAAEGPLVEELEIRRGLPPGSETFLLDLYYSLTNLALLRVEMGDLDSACTLYREALAVCEKRMIFDPGAIVDLTQVQAWMSVCLASTPDARREGLEYARRAAGNLATVSQISPESAAALRELVDGALRVTGGMS